MLLAGNKMQVKFIYLQKLKGANIRLYTQIPLPAQNKTLFRGEHLIIK